jgi:hypothetical protein
MPRRSPAIPTCADDLTIFTEALGAATAAV